MGRVTGLLAFGSLFGLILAVVPGLPFMASQFTWMPATDLTVIHITSLAWVIIMALGMAAYGIYFGLPFVWCVFMYLMAVAASILCGLSLLFAATASAIWATICLLVSMIPALRGFREAAKELGSLSLKCLKLLIVDEA
ncbi:MAG TPA: hypothetical protein VNG90_03175 [Candidatus Acidoferrum sp.]|nr:hypothetical protein [Candidatus Acidoferrum sp.]